MNPLTIRWFHESRASLESVQKTAGREATVSPEFWKEFYSAHEKAIDAVTLERAVGASVPRTRGLVSLCQSIGLWGVVPPKLRAHLIYVDLLGPDSFSTAGAGNQSVGSALTFGEWQQRVEIASRFVFYMENHIAAVPSVLHGITVA